MNANEITDEEIDNALSNTLVTPVVNFGNVICDDCHLNHTIDHIRVIWYDGTLKHIDVNQISKAWIRAHKVDSMKIFFLYLANCILAKKVIPPFENPLTDFITNLRKRHTFGRKGPRQLCKLSGIPETILLKQSIAIKQAKQMISGKFPKDIYLELIAKTIPNV